MPKPMRLHNREDEGGARRLDSQPTNPAPTVMADGIGSVNTSQYTVTEADSKIEGSDKPPYRVPPMTEIANTQPNGFNVVSTFSGCGGSSLGYKMAGFNVLWASEFVPSAQETYRANFPNTILDTRDIRTVGPEDILYATGLRRGDLDLLDGSPPCASFSTAGKRDKHWGQVKNYSDVRQRTDDLFFEFTRILRGLMPKVFVAENVSGLVKGVAKGYFLEILADLKAAGYRVTCKVLDAQWLGVPQCRQRCIFVGVRNDLVGKDGLSLMPAHPKPLPYRYSVREAIPWIAGVKHDSMGLEGSREYDVDKEPLGTVRCPGGGANTRYEVTAHQGVPSGGDYNKQTRKARSVDEPLPTVVATPQGRMTPEIVLQEKMHGDVRSNSSDDPCTSIRAMKAGGIKVVAHGGNAGFSKEAPRSLDEPTPTIGTTPNSGNGNDSPGTLYIEAESDISGYAIGNEWDAMNVPGGGSGTEQSDKYFQLVKAAPGQPSPTITGEGGNPSIASVVHPTQRRKFSIAELKRICAFPDDFILTGSYAQQWERLGRAVPPVMMRAIAATIRDEVLGKIGSSNFVPAAEPDVFSDES